MLFVINRFKTNKLLFYSTKTKRIQFSNIYLRSMFLTYGFFLYMLIDYTIYTGYSNLNKSGELSTSPNFTLNHMHGLFI